VSNGLLEIEQLEKADEVNLMLNMVNIYDSLLNAELVIDEQLVLDTLD